MIVKIKGIYEYDGVTGSCNGEIGSIRYDHAHGTFYASWQMISDKGERIAGLSRNYFIGIGKLSEEAAIPLILDNIAKYKIGRLHVFRNLEIDN